MTDNIKKESSSSGGSTDAGIKGFQAAGSPLVKRKMLNASKPFEEEVNLDELFEEAVIEALLNGETIEESVKKRGSQWTIIDDQTGSQLGSYAKRSVAWEKQRQIKKAKKAQNNQKESHRRLGIKLKKTSLLR